MTHTNCIRHLSILLAVFAIAGVAAGCAGQDRGTNQSSTEPQASYRSPENGLKAVIPSGWQHVKPHNLPGAVIPLQVASFETERRVTSICQPGRILGEIPTGGALLQILDNSPGSQPNNGGPAAHSTATESGRSSEANSSPLETPVSLGKPASHECGEAYTLSIRAGAGVLQARIWTSPTGLSEETKTQVEGLLDSLR